MPQAYSRRDVQLVVDHLKVAIDAATNLSMLQPDRSLLVAITEMQTGSLWLKELAARTPESLT